MVRYYDPEPILDGLVDAGSVSAWDYPTYSGNPANSQILLHLYQYWTGATPQGNAVFIGHTSAGTLYFRLYDSAGSLGCSAEATWSPTANNWYHLEFDWDMTALEARAFVDGTQHGLTQSIGFARSGTIRALTVCGARLGQVTSQWYVDEIIMYDVAKHTSNFTPPTTQLDLPGSKALDVGISTLTGESGLNSYKLWVESGYIENVYQTETLDSPENEHLFTGQVVPYQIVSLEPLTLTSLRATFNRKMNVNSDLLDPGRYSLSGGLEVLGVILTGDKQIDLVTSGQTAGETYELSVSVP